jgi:putative heme iron utilization protein
MKSIPVQNESLRELASLIRTQRIAALGTLQDNAPMVSMVLYAAAADFTAFYIHVSQLAKHTRNLQGNSRVSLLISESEARVLDPQTVARVSILGIASRIARVDSEYEEIKSIYIKQNPQTEPNFDLHDFDMYRIDPTQARFIAGFGKIFDLGKQELSAVATIE